jgi:ribonuclease P protein component
MQFARRSRLLKPAEFKQVFNQAHRSGDESFRILARANELHHHRLGMAVSKKACPRAVGRNRIKRIVRESFRTQIAGQVADTAIDFVVMPTAKAVNQSNEDLVISLKMHWFRLINKVVQPGRTN